MKTIDADALINRLVFHVNLPSDVKELLEDEINEMPTIQPDQRWIPCEEALPEEETYVLISKKPSPLSGKKWCVTIAGRFIDGRSGKVEWRDIGFGRIYDDDVLAWMPRPERYIGEQE